jgi:predicted ribosome quality control (RQC) complex YloA/Tae2 family protein
MSGQDKDKKNRQPDAYEYELPGGYQVLAGKTDAENDFLSIKFAAPNDYWFHVRGMPGSHVILRLGEKEEPAKDIIKQAAAVAAYHSKARSGGVVPVSCTRAKHVSKSRGNKPGTVHIRKETVIKVRPAVPDKQE